MVFESTKPMGLSGIKVMRAAGLIVFTRAERALCFTIMYKLMRTPKQRQQSNPISIYPGSRILCGMACPGALFSCSVTSAEHEWLADWTILMLNRCKRSSSGRYLNVFE
ncbi:hypothetical protein Ancab_017011 [Ancistrocladus abbreviatus]